MVFFGEIRNKRSAVAAETILKPLNCLLKKTQDFIIIFFDALSMIPNLVLLDRFSLIVLIGYTSSTIVRVAGNSRIRAGIPDCVHGPPR